GKGQAGNRGARAHFLAQIECRPVKHGTLRYHAHERHETDQIHARAFRKARKTPAGRWRALFLHNEMRQRRGNKRESYRGRRHSMGEIPPFFRQNHAQNGAHKSATALAFMETSMPPMSPPKAISATDSTAMAGARATTRRDPAHSRPATRRTVREP